jgi:hypothetical protein
MPALVPSGSSCLRYAAGALLALAAPAAAQQPAQPQQAPAAQQFPAGEEDPRSLHPLLKRPGRCWPWTDGIPAPGWRQQPTNPTELADSIIAYGARLRFVTAPGRSHRRNLRTPEEALASPVEQLRCDTEAHEDGRVVARIDVIGELGATVNGIPLRRGITYVWVQPRPGQPLRTVLVQAGDRTMAEIRNPVRLHQHGRTGFGYVALLTAPAPPAAGGTGEPGDGGALAARSQLRALAFNRECDLGCCGGYP